MIKDKFLIPIGSLCIALYFILLRFTNTPDFVLGMLIGISIPTNLIGIYKTVRKQKVDKEND